MSQAELTAHIDTLVDTFVRLVASARAGDTAEADRAGLDTLSAKLLAACSQLLDLTAELKHAAALAAAFKLQGQSGLNGSMQADNVIIRLACPVSE